MTDPPPFTILSDLATLHGGRRIRVRQAGGRTVTVNLTAAEVAAATMDDAIQAALDHLPALPGPDS